jgi:hypothetical protein
VAAKVGTITEWLRPSCAAVANLFLEDYTERILAFIAEQPDRTLDELIAAMHKRGLPL